MEVATAGEGPQIGGSIFGRNWQGFSHGEKCGSATVKDVAPLDSQNTDCSWRSGDSSACGPRTSDRFVSTPGKGRGAFCKPGEKVIEHRGTNRKVFTIYDSVSRF